MSNLLDLVDQLLGDILQGNVFTDLDPYRATALQRPSNAAKTMAGMQADMNKMGGGGENSQVTLVIEGTDELSDVLAKVISVKQVKRARTV